jgi:chemotaxis protein MotB
MNSQEDNDNPFSLSIGDLMSAMLFIFLLLLSVCLIELNNERKEVAMQKDIVEKQKDQIAQTVGQHQKVRSEIIQIIHKNIGENLEKWNATFDTTALTICFPAEAAFPINSSQLNDSFTKMLDNFFPQLITTLTENNLTYNGIDEIRIEGHASPEGDYFKNMELSQDRANAVLNYCYPKFRSGNYKQEQLNWVEKKVNSCGMSSSHPVFNQYNTAQIDTLQSRRVQFKLIPNVDIKAIEHAIE